MRRTLITIALSLAVIPLAGCDSAGTSIAVPPQATIAPTNTPLETPSVTPVGPTPTLNYKELFLVHEQETNVAIRTEVALTGVPTWTPGPPPTGPTATPELGLATDCVSKNSYEPQFVTCWAGIYNGRIVNVWSGHEGRGGDKAQGVVLVYTRGTRDTQLFQTADKVGAVQITSIDGTLFTLTTVNHQPTITYVFDISTRQWVSPPPTPSPSLSPLPTVTILPWEE